MSSINGFGTTFYGECDFIQDGSYISTYWLILAYVPIIPLYSVRIFHADKALIMGSSQYQLAKLPIHWKQVFRTYGYLLAILLGIGLFVVMVGSRTETVTIFDRILGILCLIVVIIIGLLPLILRYLAKKKAGLAGSLMESIPPTTKKLLIIFIVIMILSAVVLPLYSK